MLFTKFVALALAALVAAEPIPVEQDNEVRAVDQEVEARAVELDLEARDVEQDLEARDVEQDIEARAPYLARLYSRPNFKGPSLEVPDYRSGQCIPLPNELREKVRSINVDQRKRDVCILYDRKNCRGSPRTFKYDVRSIHVDGWSSVRCFRGHR